MPARKPSSLNKRHDTKADIQARKNAEDGMTPKTEIPIKPPVVLKGHTVASAIWRKVVGLNRELKRKIATSLDVDVLVKYCLLEEETISMAKLRDGILKDHDDVRKQAGRIKDAAEKVKLYEVANALLARYQGMDARLDGKRKLLFSMSQSLYMTPRSRAGVVPDEKEPDGPVSEMDGLL